jgi:hypothetical protein
MPFGPRRDCGLMITRIAGSISAEGMDVLQLDLSCCVGSGLCKGLFSRSGEYDRLGVI